MALPAPPDSVDIHTWSKLADDEHAQHGTSDLVYGSLKDLVQPRAERVNQAFSQATDELKKVQLRSLVDDYRVTLSEMQEALGDWDYTPPETAASAAVAVVGGRSVPSAPSVAMAISTAQSGGLMFVLKRLPIIGNILRVIDPEASSTTGT